MSSASLFGRWSLARSTSPRGFALAAIALGAVACGGGETTDSDDDIDDGAACNPLGFDQCLMPWPSMAYLEADPDTATGYQLAVPEAAMPVNVDGVVVKPVEINRWDGFSPSGPILARFEGGVSADGLPGHADIDASLAADSPIVLLRVDTGERVPFFAEVDIGENDPAERTLIIRPLVRLAAGQRYAVGITDAVKDGAGAPLVAPAAFAEVRDGGTLDHPRGAQTTAGFEAMFTALADAGYPRADLVLAWDFVTASDEFLTSDLTKMRDDAIAEIGEDGAGLTFETEEVDPGIALHRYVGTFTSPSFLTNDEAQDSVMVRDAAGRPMLNGTHPARFAAIVPSCVASAELPRPAIVFGHGVFGSAEEYLDDGFVQDLAEDYCFIIIAGDFIGLTKRQLAVAPLATNDLNRAPWLTDKLTQSIIDFIALEYLTREVLPGDARFQVEGQSVIDASKTYYLGGSLGGTMGGTFMAYDPNITRGVLAVPGANWSLFLERSTAWQLLAGAAEGAYVGQTKPEQRQLVPMLLGMALEPIDPITTAGRVIQDPLPGVPAKDLLLWEGVGDSLISNIATEMLAREMGLSLIGPSVRTPWGMTEGDTAEMASGLLILDDEPTPMPSEFNEPEDDNGTHSGINRKAAALRAVEAFVLEGDIVNGCMIEGEPAPCACASTTACD
jgi:hypothetical protein